MKKHLVTPKSLFEIFTAERPEQTRIVAPYLLSGTMTMIYSPSGHGKSLYCFNLALQIAQGGIWLGQECRDSKVLYVDGEMGGREWLKRIPENIMFTDKLNTNFKLICPDDFPNSGNVPSIGSYNNLKMWLEMAAPYDVIIIDNYLTTCRPETNKDSDLDVWYRVQDFIIQLRNQNKAVIMVHHASKSGVQYGTVLKEVIVNTILRIRQFPNQYLENGVSLEVRVQKDRGNVFQGKNDFLVDLVITDEGVYSYLGDLDKLRADYILQHKRYGTTNAEMAEALGITVGKVKEIAYRFKKQNENETEKDELWNI
jgi:putative DNA primase/helicase